ncbi:hypothetical protein GZ77_02865 [Endozoicomonas montiporae]|uniref:Uncharacterized protein n=2 Tax=Endozoicomonas montiporae TaxID=1027273 RepID=A0A081NAU8_9GAMM|nr:hypothetical protein EZMO1_2670 [Endozoicomonas montiporae CL-33]KEQ15571.1 hypothetical protein GZ77_02865 [Endozoicomonas montiporae]
MRLIVGSYLDYIGNLVLSFRRCNRVRVNDSFLWLLFLSIFLLPLKAKTDVTHIHFIVNLTSNHGHSERVWSRLHGKISQRFGSTQTPAQSGEINQTTPTFSVERTDGSGSATSHAAGAYTEWLAVNTSNQESQLLIVAVGGMEVSMKWCNHLRISPE